MPNFALFYPPPKFRGVSEKIFEVEPRTQLLIYVAMVLLV